MDQLSLPQIRHPELVSGSYFSDGENSKMLKQVQHDGGVFEHDHYDGRLLEQVQHDGGVLERARNDGGGVAL